MRVKATRGARARVTAVATVLALAVAFAGCGDDEKTATTTSDGSTTLPKTGSTKPQTTTLGQGVTETTVKVGVVLIDYDNEVISANIDFKRGDQEAIARAFIDWINGNGGVAGGKKIEPVFHVYAPLGTDPPLGACTKLTEDEKVFATIGVLYEPTGAAQVCFTKQHNTILITHELAENIVQKAPPGLLLTTDALAERTIRKMFQLAKEKGLLDGKKFGLLAEQGSKTRLDDVAGPELKKLGLEVGSSGVLQLEGTGDTTAAQAQLDSVIERWKNEGVNAVFISGLGAVSKVFVQKIRAGLPGVLILTDADSSAKGAGQDAVNAGLDPNPYAGVIALVGLTDQEQFETPSMQECVRIWETKSGTKVVAPKDLTKGADGKREEIWITVRDMCSDFKFFKAIADRIGQYLNNENWVDAVDNFGPIEIVGQTESSLGKGKYDASDSQRLVEFDPTAGATGDWKPIP
jgi:hypothetical protein